MAGQKTISNVTPAIGAIKIQQSTYGLAIPIVWGRTRISGNLIWYGDFKATPHTEVTQSGGKGGGAPRQTSTTYTYSASVAMALCQGPIMGIRTAWRGKKIYGGTSYVGMNRLNTQDVVYAGEAIYTGVIAGWTDVSVELRTDADFEDTFRTYRAGSYIPLIRGIDYTAVSGVYTFAPGAVNVGETVRLKYTYTSTTSGVTVLSDLHMDLFPGTPAQAPWSYLTTNHPDQALGYSSIAYVAGANYSLDDGATVENHAFEVESGFMFSSIIPDASPAVIVADALSNPQYGARFGAEKLGPMADYNAACAAQGIFVSPALTEQTSAAEFLQSMAALTNVGMVWSGGVLKFIPYSDTPLTGNGFTFTPNTSPIYDLTDDDFQPVDDDGPIKVSRGSVGDTFNSVKIEFCDRANAYNIGVMEQSDQADIQENGLRPMQTITANWITEASVAKIVATLILQRSMFVRNTYEFTLGWTKVALEPMDLVTLSDLALGMDRLPVRILSVEEDDSGYLRLVAEDFPKGSASATLYPSASGSGFYHNYNESPGGIAPPVIFEAPAPLASLNGGLEIWLATGSSFIQYGGCEVWVSLTGSNYERAAVLNGSSRFGVTTSALPGRLQDEVTSDVVGVQLAAGGQMISAAQVDMEQLTTLCYVGGEFISYQTATLTGAGAYTIGNQMHRGAYLSPPEAHAVGAQFVRCDEALAKMPLSPDYIGKTLFIKLLPFNRYGGGLADLAAATEYTYTVTGIQANNPPIAPKNLTVEGAFTISTAKFKWDRVPNAANYNVQIWAGAPLAKVREVKVGNALRFDYSASDSKVDGGPYRALTIKVQGIHANGAVGPFSTLAVTNPQVGALGGVSARTGALAVQFSCARPADPDFSGILVWLSTVDGFTPDAASLVYDGPNTAVTLDHLVSGASLTNGSTYYLRAAGYDTFDREGLNISAQVSVTLTSVTGVQTAIVRLYQWNTAAPPVPTGTSTFTWATAVNSAYSDSDGWSTTVPTNPGTPLLKLYAARVGLSVPAGTPVTTVSYASASVAAESANGGGISSGTAIVYQWALTIPAGPAGAASYVWADGTFGAAPSGWALNPPAPVFGNTLWAAKVQVTDSAAATSTAFNWTAAGVTSIGYAGTPGTNGASYVAAYCASVTPTTTTTPAATTGRNSLPAVNGGGITGTWSSTVPSPLASGEYLYQSDGIYNPATDSVAWSIPYWSSLKVGALSAISANFGTMTAGSMTIGGKFSVSTDGDVEIKSSATGGGAGLSIKNQLVMMTDTTGAPRIKLGNMLL